MTGHEVLLLYNNLSVIEVLRRKLADGYGPTLKDDGNAKPRKLLPEGTR